MSRVRKRLSPPSGGRMIGTRDTAGHPVRAVYRSMPRVRVVPEAQLITVTNVTSNAALRMEGRPLGSFDEQRCASHASHHKEAAAQPSWCRSRFEELWGCIGHTPP